MVKVRIRVSPFTSDVGVFGFTSELFFRTWAG